MKNKKIKNLPEKIYLQIGEDCTDTDWNDIYPGNEISWCTDKIYPNDVVYVLDKRRSQNNLTKKVKEQNENHT